MWKFRFYLTRDRRGLTKFLKSVTWRDPSEVKQAVEELLPQWTEIDMDDALELLGPGTVDSRVRAFAVKQLNRAEDEVCILINFVMLYNILVRNWCYISCSLYKHSNSSPHRMSNDRRDRHPMS